MTEPSCIDDLRKLSNLEGFSSSFINNGKSHNQTLEENCAAFKRLRIRPRVLRGSRTPDLSIDLQGEKIPAPICIAPTAHHVLAHPDGECATAKGACKSNTCMCVSLMSSKSLNDVRQASPDALLWMHIQLYADEMKNIQRIREAERLNYKAIVLTVDAPFYSRVRMKQQTEFPMPKNADGNFFLDFPNEKRHNLEDRNDYLDENLLHMTWESVDWLCNQTKLPIILKGVLTMEDSIECLNHRTAGIIVSNHGGRRLDGLPATIEALPDIIEAVAGKIDVYLDGSIRSGMDVFKALAFGAKAVFIGRPILWGLAYDGEDGVARALEILSHELKHTMINAGCSSIGDIKKSMVVHKAYYYPSRY